MSQYSPFGIFLYRLFSVNEKLFRRLFMSAIVWIYTGPNNKKRHINQSQTCVHLFPGNGFNPDFCVLIDMSILLGKKRVFVDEFSTVLILSLGLCSFGSCNYPCGSDFTKQTNPRFSNVPDYLCSSFGKYRIGKEDQATGMRILISSFTC